MSRPSNDKLIDFIKCLWIWSKSEDAPEGKYMQLKDLYEEQLQIINALLDDLSIVILKARQIGSTTCIAAVFFTIWFWTDKPEKMAIFSYSHDAAEKAFSKCKLMYKMLPDSMKKLRPAQITANKMVMLDSGAFIAKFSMEQKGAGLQGDSFSRVYLTEFGMAKDPEQLKAKAIIAMGTSGQRIFEGTAEYIGDGLYHEYLNAEANGYTRFFFPWTEHTNYVLPVDGTEVWDSDEMALLKEGLSHEQLAFRRYWKLQLGESKFLAMFPRTFEEAYQQAPGSFIEKKYLDLITTFKTADDIVCYQHPPEALETYVIGLDMGAGVNQNYSSAHVINARTYKLMATYRSNSLLPQVFSDRVAEMSRHYNKASVNAETNNTCGGIAMERLSTLGIPLVLIDGKPWVTSESSRRKMHDALRMQLLYQSMPELDDFTYQDLCAAQMDAKGKLIDNKVKAGSHNDGLTSLALAIIGAENVTLPPRMDWNRIYEAQPLTRRDLGRIR